jgi:hypothetical protein
MGAILTPFGYAAYTNRPGLVNALYKDQPWATLTEGTLRVALADEGLPATKSAILYLKSSIPTDASIALSNVLNSSFFEDVILDDPSEMTSQTLQWYIEHVRRADAVVAHFLSDNHANSKWHNLKCSLVCGLARAFNKPTMMVAHAPYSSVPLDYSDMLKIHANAMQCRTIAQHWLDSIQESVSEHWLRLRERQTVQTTAAELRHWTLGEPVAENEEDQIDQYFVETSAFDDAMAGRQTIFVGRKGTGKTANLYVMAKLLQAEARTHVCIIKPVGYEVEGILRMLKQTLPLSEKGYLVESLWKFLLYTELASSVTRELQQAPSYFQPSDAERELISFIERNTALITPPFSSRLQTAVEALLDVDQLRPGNEQRARVSERLHDGIIRELRDLLGRVLSAKRKVAILVDNLDKAWGRKEDVAYLAELILGVLAVSGRIREEFEATNRRQHRVNLSVTIFLRSDIYSII